MDRAVEENDAQELGLLHGRLRVLERIATRAPVDETLEEIIALVEAQEPGVCCGILSVSQDGTHFCRSSGPRLPNRLHRRLWGLRVTPPYLGACGQAAHENLPIDVPVVANERRYPDEWRELLTSCGLASVRSTPIRGPDGRALGSLALYYRDVPHGRACNAQLIETAAHLAAIALQHERQEEDLRAAERIFRATFENAAVGIAHVATDGRLLKLNDQFCAIVGYSREELLALTFGEITHPEDLAADWANVRKLLAGELSTYSLEKRYIRKDGSLVWVILTVGIVRGHTPPFFVSIVEDITDRKQAEDALQNYQRQVSVAMRSAKAGVWSWDLRSNAVHWSPEQYALFGMDPDVPATFAQWEAAIHPEDRGRMRQLVDAMRAYGNDSHSEFRIVTPAGERWILSIGQLQRGVTGEALRYSGMNLDITDKKAAEQELQRLHDRVREDKDRLALVLDNISEEVWFHDASGRLILANSAAQRGFGAAEGRAIASHPDTPIARALAGEEIRDLEEVVTLPASGELRTRRVTSIPARGRDGAVLGVVSVIRDVTEQAAADRALALSRSRLDYATRLSGVGFWYCDLPFAELEWDERVKEHFFFEPTARITIDDFYARLHEEDRVPTRQAIDASIRHRTPYDIVYRTVHPRTGAVKWIRALGGTDYASDGTPTHFDGVTVDVSVQKLDQQRLAGLNRLLREQDRRKDEFIATLSHELRNPLAPIRAAARVIASPKVTPLQLQRSQVIIERQVTHMALLLDDLLDMARITQGKLQLKKGPVALIDVVDAAVEAVRPALHAKNHRLSLSLPAEPVALDADSLRLSQILSNLLMNAAKYSDPGGHIGLAGAVDGETLSLSVKDDGIGLAPESIPGIFAMFSQIEGVEGRSEGGLGIGLALVKGLTELHGGTVEARSGGLGHGSEFVVRLPLVRSMPLAALGDVDGAAALRAGRRILIADDNVDAAESLAMLLEVAGHEVRVAHLGRAALALAQVFRPDVALLDIGMPDLSGYEVARELRREPGYTGIRLIALTGWGQEHDRQRAMQAGFDHHLIKPIDPDRLMGLIAVDADGA